MKEEQGKLGKVVEVVREEQGKLGKEVEVVREEQGKLGRVTAQQLREVADTSGEGQRQFGTSCPNQLEQVGFF